MPIKTCNQRCSGCALTTGAEANLEPDNYIVARLAVMGPFPFYCHAHVDYDTLPAGRMSRNEFRERGMVLCTGWLEEVRKLAETGYYKDSPVATKLFADIARRNLSLFTNSDDPDEKEQALDTLFQLLKRLNEKRLKFEEVAA